MSAKFDLNRHRERLEALLEQLERRAGRVEKSLRREAQPFSRDAEDRAIELENQEVLEGLESEGQAQIAQVKAALARVAEGSWDTCDDCGKRITVARLQALPYATTCVACAGARERAART